MHALNGWLKAVRADGFILARTRVAGPWGHAVELGDDEVFNFVAERRAFVRRPGADTISPAANDWFSAVRSPHIARALARIHEAPERAWTLEELAQEAGLSRAAFARIFSASVGEPPHTYLTRWRMGIAAQLLEETDLRLTEVAPRVGYQSEFSFSRAFKLARGVSPIQYRHAAQRLSRPSPT